MTAEEEVALSNEAPIEIDEEGQISQGEDDHDVDVGVDVVDDENKAGEDKDLSTDDDDGDGAPRRVTSPPSYDDDEPPPPPPPLPDGAETSADNSGRKKKMALFAAAIGVCVGLGVGLGVGLQGDKNTKASNVVDTGNVESPEGTSTTTTTTTAATTTTTSIDGEVDPVSSTATTTTTSSYEIDEPNSTTTEATPDAGVTTKAASTEETTVAATTTAATEAAVVEPPKLYDAVIIGAGWSGIRATETLLDAGITNILVLEANDYIGGRAITINSDGSKNNPDKVDDFTNIPRDLGCAWLYATGNSMEDAIIDKGYMTGGILDNTKESTMPLDGIFYLQTRNEEDGSLTAELMEDGKELFDEIWGGFWQFRDNRLDEMVGLSYAEAIDEYIDRWNWNDDTSLQFLNLIEDVAETEYTGDSTQLDLNEIEFFPPGYSMETHYVGVPGKGYGNIAAKYAERFADKITLNAKVVEINSEENKDQPTITYVENGVTKEVKANTVLVTASLGALKAGIIDFVPSLPAWKQEVIDKMGFGLVNKCIMYWDNDEDYVWPRDEMWYMLTTPDDETSGQWTTFFNPSEFKGVPALTAWIGGDEAIEAEKQTDDEILETVMKNLKSMFPTIRNPDKVLITRWGQEETIRGTYSFPAVGRDFYDDADLLQRRLGSVYFSGEATGSGWGTTMGAWKTGQAQAEAMAEKLAEAETV